MKRKEFLKTAIGGGVALGVGIMSEEKSEAAVLTRKMLENMRIRRLKCIYPIFI